MVYVVFDSDVIGRPEVQTAIEDYIKGVCAEGGLNYVVIPKSIKGA